MSDSAVSINSAHRMRLLHIWRSAGWPCRDVIEIDLLAANLVTFSFDPDGRETLRLTGAGFQCLAEARQRNRRALSRHDQLAEQVARQLARAGRVVWRELSLRAKSDALADASSNRPADADAPTARGLWPDEPAPAERRPPSAWRIARPDVFSVRNTSVEDYLQPVVHEVKVSRADLLSDLRNAAKRQSYQWLCCECYFVFPAGVAQPNEIPDAFGIWVLQGGVDNGHLELLRPARHAPCRLPFAVWMALAKTTPWSLPEDDLDGHSHPQRPSQYHLGAETPAGPGAADA